MTRWIQKEENMLRKHRGETDSAQGESVKQSMTKQGWLACEHESPASPFLPDPWMAGMAWSASASESTLHSKGWNSTSRWEGRPSGIKAGSLVPAWNSLAENRGKAKGCRGLPRAAAHLSIPLMLALIPGAPTSS